MSTHVLFKILSLILVLLTFATILLALIPELGAREEKVYVAFIWHYHQPWYYSPDETHFILPWVRMHSIGNYYKMAYILSKYPEVKATFTFSGSLLEQLVDYVEGGKMDVRETISWRVVNGTITREDVFSMLRIPGGFFDVNWARIVDKSPRYRELRGIAQSLHNNCSRVAKTSEELVNCVVDGFTRGNLLHQNVLDLAVLFNLLWIDPQVAREEYPEIYGLMIKAYSDTQVGFTAEDLAKVLSVQRDIMRRLVSAYRELVDKGQVEVIPVPYSHPLAPLLTATGFTDDLEVHVKLSIELFKKYLNVEPRGIWPAEQAVNEYVVHAFRRAGVSWTVTDSSLLATAGLAASDIENIGVPWYIEFQEGRIYVLFRETELSNLISFQYSSWDQDLAVKDLVSRLLSIRARARGPRLVVIALDGENPWEHYPEFGDVFLNKLYSKLLELEKQGLLETTTPGEFVESYGYVAKELPLREYRYLDLASKDISNFPINSYGDAYSELPRKQVTARLPEGSWSGGELATWIGHRQENVAWMWLVKAREDVLRKLNATGLNDLYRKSPEVAKYILKAEASDWWWWYGGDGGGSPALFDPLFKAYLLRAYELAQLTPPNYLKVTAYPDGTPIGTINAVAPSLADRELRVDGVVEDTWRQLVSEEKALRIVVGSKVPEVYVALNSSIICFAFSVQISELRGVKIAVYFTTPNTSMSPHNPGYNVYPRNSQVDLGIHLVRELLVDPVTGTIEINGADGRGGWFPLKRGGVIAVKGSPLNYTLELAVKIPDLELALGQLAYFAIVIYRDGIPEEWSSRLGLVHQLYIPAPLPEVVGKVVVDVEDPVGDDDGLGGLQYPFNPVFKPGVFDLTRFTLIDLGDKLMFRFNFRELGGNPWGGPNGWSMQQIHVYIKAQLSAEGKYEAIGLNVIIEHGWHMALLIGPGWDSAALPKGQKTGLYYYDKDTPIVQNGYLKAYADHALKAIVVEVSKDLLYDVENAEKWLIVVAVTSHDGYGTNMIRPFRVGGGEWAIGVPSTPEYSLALLTGVFPYVLDILASTREEQYSMLKSFNSTEEQLAKIRGVSAKPITFTQPHTFTPTTTLTTETSVLTTPVTTSSPTPTTYTVSTEITTVITTTSPTLLPTATPSEALLALGLLIAVVLATVMVAILLVKRGRTGSSSTLLFKLACLSAFAALYLYLA